MYVLYMRILYMYICALVCVCVCVVCRNYLEVQFTRSMLSQSAILDGIVMSCAKLFLLPFLVFVTLHDRMSSMT